MNRFYKGDTCQDCGRPVTVKNKSGFCRSCRMRGNQNTVGRRMSEAQRLHLSKIRLGKNNPNWRGDDVGNNALHSWVKAYFKKPNACDNCKESKPLDLANKGVYNRDFENWGWLCRRCHMVSDGRLENLR